MNGDFLSLLPKTAPAPPTGSIFPTLQPLQATTVFAFQCREGVMIAGDHRATAGNTIFSDQAEKILELDSHSLMAVAGVPSTAFEMARTLQTSFEFYRRSQLQPMTLTAKIRALSTLLRDNLPATIQGIGMVAPIFVGVDTTRSGSRPQIFFYDPLGAQFEAASHAGSGSGSGSIKSVLHYLEQWGSPRPAEMELEEAIRLANRLLLTAAEFDAATGGVQPDRGVFATLRLLTGEGIRTVDNVEQKKAWSGGR